MFRSAGAYFSNSGAPIYSGAAGFRKESKMFRSSSPVGPLLSYRDGSLGGPIVGPTQAYRDGSLGCTSCRGTGEYFAANGVGEYFAANGLGGLAWWDALPQEKKNTYMLAGGAVAAVGVILLLRSKKRR